MSQFRPMVNDAMTPDELNFHQRGDLPDYASFEQDEIPGRFNPHPLLIMLTVIVAITGAVIAAVLIHDAMIGPMTPSLPACQLENLSAPGPALVQITGGGGRLGYDCVPS
jgi:hypothetical protein